MRLLRIIALMCLLAPGAFAQTYSIAPNIRDTLVDANGNPGSGWKVYSYLTGTATPTATYANTSGTANGSASCTIVSTCVVADSAGRVTMFLSSAACLKLVVTNASDVVQYQLDPVCPLALNSTVTSIAGAPFITRTASAALTNETSMGALGTGLVYNTTTTGVPSIVTAGTGVTISGGKISVDSGDLVPTVTCTGTGDQALINSAISAIPSGGGKVLISEGTCGIASTITIATSNIVVQGMGDATVLSLAAAANVDVITIGDGTNSYSGIQVLNLKIDGNKADQSSAGDGIQVTRFASEITVDHVRIVDVFADGIKGPNAIDNDHNRITNNTIESPGDECIEWAGDDDILDGNTCVTPTGDGIFVDSNAQGVISNSSVINPGHYGIVANSGQLQVQNNSVLLNNSTTARGIHARGLSNVLNNNIRTGNSSTAGVTGIYHEGSSLRIIAGNNIYFRTATSGNIGIGSYATQTTITGNTISQEDYDAGLTNNYGIDAANNTDLAITGNAIYQWNTCIRATSVIDVTISGNNILYCSDYGVNATNAFQLGINGNAFESMHSAVYSSPAASTTNSLSIVGNQVYNSSQDAFYLGSVQNSTITGNVFKDTGVGTANTYTDILLLTANGTNRAKFNTISGNSAMGTIHKYGVREDTNNDGPNTITGNDIQGAATTAISAQQAGTITWTDTGALTTPGAIIFADLKTTGSATGKNVVCVDTSTGQLYASSSGTECLN